MPEWLLKTSKIIGQKVKDPVLRRKLSRQQFTNIVMNNGRINPLISEKGQLTFTSVKPRKADFYIETEVPVSEYLPKELDRPYMFTKGNLSERFKSVPDFRPNIYDNSVKVFRKNSNGKYELIPKDQLDNINLLQFGITKKPIITEKPIRLNAHTIHLPESPIQTNSGSTLYLDEALSSYNNTKLPKYLQLNPNLFSPEFNSYYDPVSGNFIKPYGVTTGNDVSILKSKINPINEISDVAKSMISSAKKYYLENYNIAVDALTDEEWGKLNQTLLDKNSDKEILFHSTFTPFDKVLKEELLKANQGYLGRGFYVSDVPQTDYGPITIPITMPKGKQIVLSTIRSGINSPRFLHADNEIADQLLTSLRTPFVRWSKKGFQSKEWGYWPGMKETSRDPKKWNDLIKDLDLNFVKSTTTSKGGGYKYPEIMIPEDKVDLIDMLFKSPKELKQGGILKAQQGAIIKTAGKAIKTLSKPKGITKSLFKVAPLAQVQSDAGQVVNSTFNNWRLETFGEDALSKPVTYEELDSFVNLLDASNSPYYSNLVNNFKKYGKGLMVKDTYHDALSPQELLEEMTFMAIPERPFNQDLSLVNEYYSTDVLPRLLKNIKDEGITLTPEQTKYITEMYSNPTNGVNMKFSYMPKGWGGYSSGNSSIRYSYRYYPTEVVDNGTIVHELHHSLRDRLKSYLSSQGYTNFAPSFDSEGFLLPQVENIPENLLSKSSYRNSDIWGQYTPKEITLMEPLAMTKENSSDKTPIAEIAAVAAGNARFNTWMNLKEKLGRTPSISEINTKIDNFDPLKLYTNFSNLPYGKQIGSLDREKIYKDIEQIYRKTDLYNLISGSRYRALPFYKKWFVPRPIPKVANTGTIFTDFQNKYAKSLKEAMKGIAGFTGVGVGLSNINNND